MSHPACPPSRSGPRYSHAARGRAFTLVEVAATVCVLALVITTSITTMQRAFSNLDTARNISIASNILQTEIEKERLFTWAAVSDARFQPNLDAAYLRNTNIAGRFAISRSVAEVAGHAGQMVQVTLTVRWRGYDGRSQSRSYTTYFAQGGLNDFLYNQA
jgi:hypothetical protein